MRFFGYTRRYLYRCKFEQLLRKRSASTSQPRYEIEGVSHTVGSYIDVTEEFRRHKQTKSFHSVLVLGRTHKVTQSNFDKTLILNTSYYRPSSILFHLLLLPEKVTVV